MNVDHWIWTCSRVHAIAREERGIRNRCKMLKHCSPSSVDVRRRSRRNLLTIVDNQSQSNLHQLEDMIVTDHVLVPNDNDEINDEINKEIANDINDEFDDEINDEEVEFDTTSVRSSYSTSTSCSIGYPGPRSRHRVVLSLHSEPRKSPSFVNRGEVTRTVVNHHDPENISLQEFSSALPSSAFKVPPTATRYRKSTPVPSPTSVRASLTAQKIPIKVYSRCLSSDIEYKTLSVNYQTTTKELIWILLSKFKMRHRDPKLFYLTMDINIKRTGIPLRRTLSLEDDSRPAELKSCHPWGECRFTLQMRKGGLVRIYASVLMPESKYKCLLISDQTTVSEVINILFRCYGLENAGKNPDDYCLYEQCQRRGFERKLHPDDQPVPVQSTWPTPVNQFSFVLKAAGGHRASQFQVLDPNEGFVDDEDALGQFDPTRYHGMLGSQARYRFSDIKEEELEELADIIVEEVVTSVDDLDGYEEDHHDEQRRCNKTLDTSYSSGGEGSTASSEYSALRFGDSPMSSSSR